MQPNNQIFQTISKEKLIDLLHTLGGFDKHFFEGECMLMQGEQHHYISFLASGSAHATRTDARGRENDYTSFPEGTFFSDILALSKEERSPVSVFANTDCKVIEFTYEALLRSDDPDAGKLLQMILVSVSERFFGLQKRVFYLTRSSLREKIEAFLTHQSENFHSESFSVPFNRDAMAAYLYCDRSALSRELSAMKAEGTIDYRKNHFVILKKHFSKND